MSDIIDGIDFGNDFINYDPLFKGVDDIENFIMREEDRKARLPVLTNLLKLRKEKKLELTPTENEFYFDMLFNYICDVYRIPHPHTYELVLEWLDHIESSLVYNGLSFAIRKSYELASIKIETTISLLDFCEDKDAPFDYNNYYTDIGEKNDYYNSKRKNVIESFWVKSSRSSGQPVEVGDESYMRVHVFDDYVYIFGCDDSSYIYKSKNQKELNNFLLYLKHGAPVWNFHYFDYEGFKINN